MSILHVLSLMMLAQAVDPPRLEEPKPKLAPATDEELSADDPLIEKYQDCIQKLIEQPDADQAFMRKCLGLEKKSIKKLPQGQRRILNKADVTGVISKGLPNLSGCYEPLLNQAKALGILAPEGRIDVEFEVDQTGVSRNVRFFTPFINDMGFLQCLREQVLTWRFPKTAMTQVANVQVGFDVVADAKRKGNLALAAGFPKLQGADFGYGPDDLVSVFRTNAASVRQCYDQLLNRKPATAGSAMADITVDPLGKVKSVRFRQFTITDQTFKSCLNRAITRWRFPPSPTGEEIVAKYPPWTFAPKSTEAPPK